MRPAEIIRFILTIGIFVWVILERIIRDPSPFLLMRNGDAIPDPMAAIAYVWLIGLYALMWAALYWFSVGAIWRLRRRRASRA